MSKKTIAVPQADLAFENGGSIVMIRPLNEVGRRWLDDNVHTESWQHFGGAIAAEPRMAVVVYDGARNDGLEVRT